MLKKILIASVILISSCKKEKNFVYDVPPEFKTVVKRFITEANARGVNITIENLIIKYDNTLPFQQCAKSNVISSANDVQKIILVNTPACWLNNIQLETLIFHELGHCVLGRSHDTSLMPKGDPKTMMYPSDLELYSPCVYFNYSGGSCDRLYRRTYYIDELFNSSTPVPDWAK